MNFVIEAIRHHLVFDFHAGRLVNVVVQRGQREKITTLVECVRLFGCVLLYCLKGGNERRTL